MFSFELKDEICLKLLLKIFNIFGLATFSVERAKTKGKIFSDRREQTFVGLRLSVLYNCLFVSIVGLANYFAIDLLYTRNKKPLTVFNIIDMFQVFFGSSVSIFILIFYCVKRETAMNLTAQIYRLKTTINELSIDRGRNNDSSLLCFASFLIFHAVIPLILILTSIMNYENLPLLLGSVFRNFFVIWLFLQYSVVARIVLIMFERMNDVLTNSTPNPLFHVKYHTSPSSLISNAFGTKRLQLLSSIRDAHHSLFQICLEVNKFYGFNVLGCIAYMFICLVVFTYFLIGIVIEKKIAFQVIDYVHFFLWLVCFTSSFVVLSTYITRVTDEIDKTGMIIHQLMRNTTNNQILKELQDFSLYLLHVHVKFTAWEFCTIDGGLIQSIFSSITTYLVILVQFKLNSSAKLQSQENNAT